VTGPGLRARLTPNYEIGCKRILRTDDYYPTLTRPDVQLVTSPISRVSASAVETTQGSHTLDVLIMATGFEAVDLPIAHRIAGRGGVLLHEHWADGERAFATTCVAGFPNLFFMNGPNAGLGVGSVVDVIETQASYIRTALDHMDANDAAVIVVRASAEEDYVDDIEARMAGTVWLSENCSTWYVDARNGKVTTLWPDFVSAFRAENGVFLPEPFDFGPISALRRNTRSKTPMSASSQN
jgi:cation diffusion facilitator CzcD-associated flavoprotein CzcO